MVSAFIPLAPGESGVRQILANLERLAAYYGARPVIREVATRVARSLGDNALAFQVQKLAAFVMDRVIYVRDPVGAEFVKTPDRMLLDIARTGTTEGDCDDHVLLFAALAQSIGIPVRIAAVKIPPSPVWNHVIVIVDLDGKAYEIDLCAKGVPAPDYPEKLILSDAELSGGVGCMACAASPVCGGIC